MLILLSFQTRIYCFQPAIFALYTHHPLRGLGSNGAIVFQRLYFCPGFLFKLITSFTGRCRCSEWEKKTSNNVCIYGQCEVFFSCCWYYYSYYSLFLLFGTVRYLSFPGDKLIGFTAETQGPQGNVSSLAVEEDRRVLKSPCIQDALNPVMFTGNAERYSQTSGCDHLS